MSKRSSALALTLEAVLCGGTPPGTKITQARFKACATCSAMIMCPWCMGSKVPPKIPILLISHPSRCPLPTPSLEVELYIADPDFVPGLGAGPPERCHYALFFELPLKVAHALGTLPVRPQREPLDAFAGDLVGPVFDLLDAQSLPRG